LFTLTISKSPKEPEIVRVGERSRRKPGKYPGNRKINGRRNLGCQCCQLAK
jgi:hypothetical protein